MDGWGWAGAIGGALVGALVGVGGVSVITTHQDAYGYSLFVGLPIVQGAIAAALAQGGKPVPWNRAASAAGMSGLLSVLGLLAWHYEGIICISMATPLVAPLLFLGAWLGWLAMGGKSAGSARMSIPLAAALALSFGGGAVLPAPEEEGAVHTVWHVAAPPEKIFPFVKQIKIEEEPDWWLFRAGVAHLTESRMLPNHRRECVLSTGTMPEIISVLEPNRRLRFEILATPPSMKEMNPFGEIHPRHLTEVYRGKSGEFVLTPEGGGTRIDARSTYGLRIGPSWYWKLWSDAIVRHTHERAVKGIAHQLGVAFG